MHTKHLAQCLVQSKQARNISYCDPHNGTCLELDLFFFFLGLIGTSPGDQCSSTSTICHDFRGREVKRLLGPLAQLGQVLTFRRQ